MEFFKCSIGGEVYGSGVTEIELGGAQRTGIKFQEVCVPFQFLKKRKYLYLGKDVLLPISFLFFFPGVEIRNISIFF
jgi:hypothetical protein